MSRPLEHPGRGWGGSAPISVSSSESPEQVVAFDVYLVGSTQDCKVLQSLDFHPRAVQAGAGCWGGSSVMRSAPRPGSGAAIARPAPCVPRW